jgi:hypothetical protein
LLLGFKEAMAVHLSRKSIFGMILELEKIQFFLRVWLNKTHLVMFRKLELKTIFTIRCNGKSIC